MRKKLFFIICILFFTLGCSNSNETINLAIENETLSWNQLENVDTYTLTILEINEAKTFENNNFDLTTLNLNGGTYTLELCSDNNICETIAYEVESHTKEHDDQDDGEMIDKIIHEGRYLYNTSPTQDLVIHLNKSIDEITNISSNDTPLSFEQIVLKEQSLIISKNSLENISEDLEIEIQTNKGIIKLDLRFTDSKTPHFITDTRLTYDEDDIILAFEPLEGQLLTLSGNNITNNDYSIDDNILTIDSALIDELLEENPDRNRIIFGYQFKLDDKITLDYIFIDID